MNFEQLPREGLETMRAAGDEILESYRVLEKAGSNAVGRILREHLVQDKTFVEWDHYPEGDVFDRDNHAQYYFHAHRGNDHEHGHFHTFLRQQGMPEGTRPVPYEGEEEWPKGEDELCHLIAISMDQHGFPQGLFTTNRWVTGECWYLARDVIEMLGRFQIDHAWPCWATNRWISAMVTLFRPQIEDLLNQRDQAVADWREKHPDGDVFEDRDLDVTSSTDISVEDQIAAVARALG